MKAQLGSISRGTLKPEDLIPVFIKELESLYITKSEVDLIEAIHSRIRIGKNYWDTIDPHMDVEELIDALMLHAPEDAYFGAHPGDGSDFGFWPID